MPTLLARLKPHDPRRGHVLRRFTYAGIKFDERRGWYRIEPDVAEYLRTVHQRPADPHTPLAFDVCTDEEARALDARDKEAANPRKTATDDIELSPARADGTVPPPRKAALDDVPVSTARSERTAAPAGPSEPPRDDRRPAPTAEAPEPARDDRKPAPAPPARKDRP
jgi:hypothetical protein